MTLVSTKKSLTSYILATTKWSSYEKDLHYYVSKFKMYLNHIGDSDSDEEETRNKLEIKDNAGEINDCHLTSFDTEETRKNRNIKADQVADEIIKAFIVKRKKRLIDQDDQNDNISYEESELRLIFMGITSATLLASISMILTIMALQTYSPIRLQASLPSTKDVKLKFLSPYVTFMGLGENGYLFTMKQNTDLSFQYDWELKLPRVPQDTGYFVFNDRKAVFVISSNSNQKMTMVNGPKQHVTLAKSRIIDNFYYSGSILRVGNYAMVFGGYASNNELIESIECTSTTAIWSIKRQHWIQGPVLPKKITDCYSISTGFAVNNTNVVVLLTGLITYEKADDVWNVCIDAYTFSFDTLQWNDVKECFIESKNIYGLYNYLTCTTYFDKFSRL